MRRPLLPQSPDPPESPSRTFDVESMPVSVTTSPHKLVKTVRQLQADKHVAAARIESLRRKLEDIDNSSSLDSQPRSKRSRTSRHAANDELDSDDESGKLEEFVTKAGHKFGIICAPWLHSNQHLLQTNLDDAYTPTERFENDDNKSQGQLREVLELLRAKLEDQDLRQTWVARLFYAGLNTQRSNTCTRIRHACASIFGVDESDILRPEIRREKFRNQIGFVVDARGNGSYSSVDVPVLHKGYAAAYDLSNIFLNPVLMGLFIAIIRGPAAGKLHMVGIQSNPKTETIESIHGLDHITPGAIATVSIFARWALSADECLQPVGASTGIHYFSDYEEYLAILETGLRRKKRTIVNVIKEWDQQIFPNTSTSLVGVGNGAVESTGLTRAMALLDADSEEEEDMLSDDDM